MGKRPFRLEMCSCQKAQRLEIIYLRLPWDFFTRMIARNPLSRTLGQLCNYFKLFFRVKHAALPLRHYGNYSTRGQRETNGSREGIRERVRCNSWPVACVVPVYQRRTIEHFIPHPHKTKVYHSLLSIIQRSDTISSLILNHVSFSGMFLPPP